jgi:hypothetical protein
MKTTIAIAAALAAAMAAAPAAAKDKEPKSAYGQQQARMQQIPTCTRSLGTVAIVEPDKQWWRELNLGSPEAILKIFVQKSGCFKMVNRGASLASRNMERAMADAGELQAGSNLGRGQVKAADYFIQPDIVSANQNAGGSNVGAALGAFGGMFGGWGGSVASMAGGINVKKKEANVTLSIVNARTTEEMAMTEGFAKKKDTSWGLGAGGSWGGWDGGFAGASGGSYANTEIGQVIVLAYLDAYTKLVTQLGGLPQNAAAAAPAAGR